MMRTVKKAPILTTKKALVSDFSVNPIISVTIGNADVKDTAISKAPATTKSKITQELGTPSKITQKPWTLDDRQPKILYVTSSSARENQGSFFKGDIH